MRGRGRGTWGWAGTGGFLDLEEKSLFLSSATGSVILIIFRFRITPEYYIPCSSDPNMSSPSGWLVVVVGALIIVGGDDGGGGGGCVSAVCRLRLGRLRRGRLARRLVWVRLDHGCRDSGGGVVVRRGRRVVVIEAV